MTVAFGGERFKLGYVNSHISLLESPSQAYKARQCKDQLIISWLLNSMENRVAEIFSYLKSSLELWEAVKKIIEIKIMQFVYFKINRNLANP